MSYKDIAKEYWYTDNIKVIRKENPKKNDYNNVPVYYCNVCNSLLIKEYKDPLTGELQVYCDDCSSTDISIGHIDQWLEIEKW